MGQCKDPQPVKLVIGLLARDSEALSLGRTRLIRKFGEPDSVSTQTSFTHTRYYEKELGPNPLRMFASFPALFPRTELPDIKLLTNEMEIELAENGKRRVNLDPGYLTPGQLFLASTKDQRQRVYVGNGIYVEPTLYFRDGEFHPFEWTYPDYRNGSYFEFLKETRRILLDQLREDAAGERPNET